MHTVGAVTPQISCRRGGATAAGRLKTSKVMGAALHFPLFEAGGYHGTTQETDISYQPCRSRGITPDQSLVSSPARTVRVQLLGAASMQRPGPHQPTGIKVPHQPTGIMFREAK